MKVLVRVLVTFIAAVAALYFVFWIGGAVMFKLHMPPWIASLASLAAALIVGRFLWTHFQAGAISSIIFGAVATGGVGFAAGFFGPMILMPGANQGPLLGIFITGPAGVVIGLVWALWRSARRRA